MPYHKKNVVDETTGVEFGLPAVLLHPETKPLQEMPLDRSNSVNNINNGKMESWTIFSTRTSCLDGEL